MRLYLLPISTRRTLLYCQKFDALSNMEKKSLLDKAQSYATKLWAGWEKKDNGWQKKVVQYGNVAFRRIPYEEWGLKSVPPLSQRRQQDELQGRQKIQLIYPESVIPATKAAGVLQTLATERASIHRSRIMWCIVGMPLTIPFMLIPVIPNLPFFYLLYRAWSQWRALKGGQHIQFLSSNNLLVASPSPILDNIYQRVLASSRTAQKPDGAGEGPNETDESNINNAMIPEKEVKLLSQADGQEMVKALDIPDLEVEIERAIWQVETSISKEQDEKVKSK